jgi:hypothetical protein
MLCQLLFAMVVIGGASCAKRFAKMGGLNFAIDEMHIGQIHANGDIRLVVRQIQPRLGAFCGVKDLR